MKEQILEVLRKHPEGIRLRYIGFRLNVWHPTLIRDMDELQKAGIIEGIHIRDNANMESYTLWKIKD